MTLGAPVRACAALLALALVAAGCTGSRPAGPGSRNVDVEAQLLVQQAVLLQGWVSGSGAGLNAVMPLATATGDDGSNSGPYLLYGLDDRGATSFEVRFGDRSLARVAGREERYFSFAIPLAEGGAETLSAVVLDAGGVRYVLRRSPLTRDQLVAGLAGGQGVHVSREPDGNVRVKWDAERFVQLRLRDPATGAVLARDRRGDVTVTASAGELEIALSDGTRSAAALFRLAEHP